MVSIKTEQDYAAALQVVSPLFENEPAQGSAQGELFEKMCLLIEEYEKKHFPIRHEHHEKL